MKFLNIGTLKDKIRKSKYKYLPILIVISILFIGIYNSNLFSTETKTIYFSESFDKGIDQWKSCDGVWKKEDGTNNGIAVLMMKNYAAPYLMKKLSIGQLPSDNYMLHIKFKAASFTNEAITLASLIFPTDEFSVVLNKDGNLGFSKNLMEHPTYSTSLGSGISKDKWNDIYVYFDEGKVTLYSNGIKTLTTSYETSSPVKEIWLGAIWLGGGGNYGAPTNVSYGDVTLGDKQLLSKKTGIKGIISRFLGFISG